jgi:uncharacterized protein (TIGR01777 family)
MKVLIAGGSGFLGTHLSRSLLADGHQVWALSREPGRKRFLPGVQAVTWDGKTPAGWGHMAGEVDAIVNLTGATLAHWPWTAGRKRGFVSSRVNPARAIAQAIQAAETRPRVLLQNSAGGYYGPHGLEPVTETTLPGGDFSARLCVEWEAASKPVEQLGVRRVVTRTGIVISRDAAILQLMALPTRLFFGGRLGSGKQGIGWIHLQDEIRAFRFLLEHDDANGAYNLSAPNPISNSDFMRAIARALRRPYWFHPPAFLLRLLLGEMSTLILDGWFLEPARLLETGFRFDFATADSALRNIWP